LRRLPQAPVEVLLTVDDEAANEVGDAFSAVRLSDGRSLWDAELPFSDDFALGLDPGRGDPAPYAGMYARVSAPVQRVGRTAWSGRLGGKGSRLSGEFSFVLEQYGTVDPLLLLIFLFFTVFYQEDLGLAIARCQQQALQQCGDAGNVKVVNATRGITGAALGVSGGCQIECFERW
jgi:hypothetical protein